MDRGGFNGSSLLQPQGMSERKSLRCKAAGVVAPPVRYSFGGHIPTFPRMGVYDRVSEKQSMRDRLCAEYLSILRCKNRSDEGMRESLGHLRSLVLKHGIPDDARDCKGDNVSLRAKVWKVMLCVYEISASRYSSLVSMGPCWQYEKIENDVSRTLATDKRFHDRVQEGPILRVLNSFVCAKIQELGPNSVVYVQGMNVLLAPLLYVMPELDAFYCFESFVTHVCPTYVLPTLEGVYAGLKLLDKCLEACDPALHSALKEKNMDPAMYALPSVLTLCACTPPLEEVLKLWDYYICFGAHLNIIAILSQIISMRSAIISSDKPMNALRVFKPIDSQKITRDIAALFPHLPEKIRRLLFLHTHTRVCA